MTSTSPRSMARGEATVAGRSSRSAPLGFAPDPRVDPGASPPAPMPPFPPRHAQHRSPPAPPRPRPAPPRPQPLAADPSQRPGPRPREEEVAAPGEDGRADEPAERAAEDEAGLAAVVRRRHVEDRRRVEPR